jgi:RNA polymerase sigma-70 factor (ECF subfamily)
MHELPDSELAVLARGDDAAFEELVRRYYNDVYRLCAYFVRDREEAWDLAQDTFVKAHKGIRKFRGDASFKTWLFRIASNRSKDHLKKRRLPTTPLEDWHGDRIGNEAAGPEEMARGAELGEALERALENLSPKHRLAITLREFEGLSYEEMAETMNCRIGTVMSRLHHARRRLREELEALGQWGRD